MAEYNGKKYGKSVTEEVVEASEEVKAAFKKLDAIPTKQDKKLWHYDFEELCICGHPGADHCLDDQCCIWDFEGHEYGGACSCGCDCGTYRPQSMHLDEVDDG